MYEIQKDQTSPVNFFCGRLSRCNGGPRGFEREERQEIRPREAG